MYLLASHPNYYRYYHRLEPGWMGRAVVSECTIAQDVSAKPSNRIIPTFNIAGSETI